MRNVLLVILIVSFINCLVTNACTSRSCCKDKNNIVAIDITNASPNDANVRVQIPYFNNDTSFFLPRGEKKTLLIGAKIQRDGTYVDQRGITITSDNEIGVLVSTSYYSSASTDSYNVLPIQILGKRYTLSSYSSRHSSRGGVVLVSGPINNTNVTIYKGSSKVYSVIINKFDVFQYSCGACDLTGLKVLSDNDVYVVSGTHFTQIPSSSSQDEFIASEMFPTSAWSNRYIVPPVFPKSAFMLRVQSEDELIKIEISNTSRTYTLKRSLSEQYFGNDPVIATVSNSFLLTQYGVGYDYDNINGDPFITVVPGLDQYLNDYQFTVPHGYYNVTSYVAVIVEKFYQSGLVLDGISIQSYNNGPIKTFNVPAPLDNYVINLFKILAGFHHFSHSVEGIKFGMFVYGLGLYGPYGLGYGFYSGYDLIGSCRLSTTLTSLTDTIVSSTTTHFPSPGTITVTSRVKGSTCFKCDDLSHVGLCDTVDTCKYNEICYIKRFMHSGRIKYMTGCIEERTCFLKQNESKFLKDSCFDCCQGDYCNNKGCGENDIPDRESRGPICYDCQHVRSPAECVTISPCESHQACSIEEYKWFGSTQFSLGCGHGLCSFVSNDDDERVKRATPICHACCTEDYCNRNCTNSIHDGSAIIG